MNYDYYIRTELAKIKVIELRQTSYRYSILKKEQGRNLIQSLIELFWN
ncbi:hypothetical protein J27TS8_10660 [Robertmurraya siralis]|uniref:Uncharacterized protein n=1 Tax=Robertmurraya siralis TaxID=77777 RepID=A0A919WFY1_9BACI|nr:hypothetical protein J27TS8_10660 [Robertmurraya siralis]